MSIALLPNGQQQFTDSNGAPLAFGQVYFYIPGTSTFKDTWQDYSITTPNANPVILDAAGRATIWGTGYYRQVVKDAIGDTIWDRVTATASATAASVGINNDITALNGLAVRTSMGGTTAASSDTRIFIDASSAPAICTIPISLGSLSACKLLWVGKSDTTYNSVSIKDDSGILIDTITTPAIGGAVSGRWVFSDGVKVYSQGDESPLQTPSGVIASQTTPPSSPSFNDTYIVGMSATGAWASHDNEIARWSGSAWIFFPPKDGQFVFNAALAHQNSYTVAGGWEEKSADFVSFKTGSQVRTVGERLGDYPDIRDYGYLAGNTRAQNDAVLAAYASANQYMALPPDTTINCSATFNLGTGQKLVGFGRPTLNCNTTTVAALAVNGDDVEVKDINFTSPSYDAGNVTLGANALSGSPIKNVKLSGLSFNQIGAAACIVIHRVAGARIYDTYCDYTSYGILQQQGKACTDIDINGIIGIQMVNDLINFNGTTGSLADGITIMGVDYRGANNWTIPVTEARVLSFAGAQNVLVDGMRYRNCAGDAAVHLEDVGGDFLITNTHGQDCNVSGGNNAVFLLINSAKTVQITSSSYKKTNPTVGATYFLGTSAATNYGNAISVSGVSLYEEGNYSGGGTRLSGFDMRYHTGPFVADNVTLSAGDTFALVINATNKTFNNCHAINCINGIYGSAGALGSGNHGGKHIYINGGSFDCQEFCIGTGPNTVPGGYPEDWKIIGTRCTYAGTGSAYGTLIGNGIDCAEIGTTYGAGLTYAGTGTANHKSVYEDGTGWIADA